MKRLARPDGGPLPLRVTGHRMKRAPLSGARISAAGAVWVAAALCAVAVSVLVAPGWRGVLGAGLAVDMAAIAAIDSRSFVIPDKLVLAGLALGLVNAAIADPLQIAAGLLSAGLRALVLALLFLLFRTAYRLIRRREGLGLGDVKLAAVAGVWLGWTAAGLAVDIGALSALAAALIAALRGRGISGTTRIPFGLFFAPAIWLAWLLSAIILPGGF